MIGTYRNSLIALYLHTRATDSTHTVKHRWGQRSLGHPVLQPSQATYVFDSADQRHPDIFPAVSIGYNSNVSTSNALNVPNRCCQHNASDRFENRHRRPVRFLQVPVWNFMLTLPPRSQMSYVQSYSGQVTSAINALV